MAKATRAEREMEQILQICALRDELRVVREELDKTRAKLTKAENELNAAYDLERQGRELAEARLDSARLAEIYRRADVDPRGYLVFRPIQLPPKADWDGVTCKWDREIFNAAIDAAIKEAK